MRVIKTVAELRGIIKAYKQNNESVGCVPTMGNLHAGHLDLVAKALAKADRTVVSIFVNPTQFDKADDLEAYPRTMQDDLAHLERLGVDLVFAPTPKEMYPHGSLVTEVDVPNISRIHEGDSRPGHFKGVATVVCKLFNIISPDIAIFGQKDYQQLSLIRQMVSDLNIPTEIIGAPTIREDDGLAMSSRNNRLSKDQRKLASGLYRVLKQLEEKILSGDRNYSESQTEAVQKLSEAGLEPDYILVCNSETLQIAGENDRNLVILAAAYLGEVRLIDNLQISLAASKENV